MPKNQLKMQMRIIIRYGTDKAPTSLCNTQIANYTGMLQTTIIVYRNYSSTDRHIWFSGGFKQPPHNTHVLQVWHLPNWPRQNHTWHIPRGSSAWSAQPGSAHSDAYCLNICGKESCSSGTTCKTLSKASSVASAMIEEDRTHSACERKSPTPTDAHCHIHNVFMKNTWPTCWSHIPISDTLHADKVTRPHSQNNTASITEWSP